MTPILDVGALRTRAAKALAIALAATVLTAAAAIAWRVAAGDGLKQSVRATSLLQFRRLVLSAGLDSWGPMLAAQYRQRHGGRMFADTMELDGCKYQYPPAALLLMEVLPDNRDVPLICSRDADEWRRLEVGGWSATKGLEMAGRLATLAGALVSALVLLAMLRIGAPPAGAATRRGPALIIGLGMACGLTFYPLIWGYEIGQIQVFLNLFIAVAVLAHLTGRDAVAGVMIGLCCIFKPPYVLLLLWAALRRKWSFLAAMLAVAGSAQLVSMALHGLAPQLEYIDFLRGLARHGESYWANQSVHGLLQRLIAPASGLEWADWAFGNSTPGIDGPGFPWLAAGFPAYHPLVYWGTLVSSLAIVLLALGNLRRPAGHGRNDVVVSTLDFGLFIAAVTMASPIAWHHHYGAFLPLFAALLGALLLDARASKRDWAVLLAAYVLMAFYFLRPDLLTGNAATGLAMSTTFFGALLLFGSMLRLRATIGSRPVFVATTLTH